MIKKSDDRIRFNYSMPVRLYERLEADSKRFGIPKSNIVSCALLDYYKARGDFPEASE